MAVDSSPQKTAAGASEVKQAGSKRRLTNIPPELRLNIYDHYFANFKLDIKSGDSSIRKKKALVPALFATCKLIRREALASYEARLKTLLKRNQGKMDEKWKTELKGTQAELVVMMQADFVLLKTYAQTRTVYSRELVKVQIERTGRADPDLIAWMNKQEGRSMGKEYDELEIQDWLDV